MEQKERDHSLDLERLDPGLSGDKLLAGGSSRGGDLVLDSLLSLEKSGGLILGNLAEQKEE